MAPGPLKSPVRQLLEDRLSSLPMEADTLFIESRERARRDFADLLNQAVRRIRMAPDAEELGATLLDAAAQFSTGAALFRVSGDIAILERIRGVPDAAAFTMLEIPLASRRAVLRHREPRPRDRPHRAKRSLGRTHPASRSPRHWPRLPLPGGSAQSRAGADLCLGKRARLRHRVARPRGRGRMERDP